jgi:glutathione S-transferase
MNGDLAMKLYYSPFACSLAAHIVCREAGLDVMLARVELSTKRVEGGEDLTAVNPMGQVPTIVTDDGAMLTEVSAVLTYLADRVSALRLAPPPSEFARYQLARWLSFVGTEVHKKGLALIFAPDVPDAVKTYARASIAKPLAVVAAHLAGHALLVGETFTVADAYLFWALHLTRPAGIALDPYPELLSYYKRLQARPAIQAALEFERDAHARPFAA